MQSMPNLDALQEAVRALAKELNAHPDLKMEVVHERLEAIRHREEGHQFRHTLTVIVTTEVR